MLAYQHLLAGRTGAVVMPSFTFSASAHAVRWAGGSPAWADVREVDATLDPDDAARRVAELGAVALSATHIYGSPCQVEALQEVADRAGVPLVYDAAHAFGSRRGGTPVGRYGSCEVFSLSPTKVLVAGGGRAGRDAGRRAGPGAAPRAGLRATPATTTRCSPASTRG